MSRTFTSLLCVLMALLVSIGAKAQTDDFDFQRKSVTVGGAVADFEPNTWYLLHQRRIVNDNKVEHSEVGGLPQGAGFMHDEGDGERIFTRSIDNVPDEVQASRVAGYLVRFIPSQDHEDAYLLQFGTGNYLNIPAGSANSSPIYAHSSIYDATELNIYKIQDTDGHFSMNEYPMGVRIDNTGVGYRIPIWGSGENTGIDGNADWSIHSIVWGDISEIDVALAELEAIVSQYRQYSGTFNVGTAPGDYGEAEVEAFEAALAAADTDDPDSNWMDWTVEEFQRRGQAVIDAYEAVLASRVPVPLPDGYYRIKTALHYKTTVTDPETLEETEVEVDKYMHSLQDGDTFYAQWGSSDDLSIDAPALWKVTNLESGRFDIMNVATETRFDEVNRSTRVSMTAEGGGEIVVTPAITIDGVLYVNLNVYPQNAEEGRYLHQGDHNNGNGTQGGVVGWYTSFSNSDLTVGGSEWQFIPVSDEEAQAIVEAYAPYKDIELMKNDYQAMLEDGKAKLEIARDIQTNIDNQALITDAEQLSSPFSDGEEGLHIEYLIDGDASTFWHSDWHGQFTEAHYLQVEIREADVQNAVMQFTRRNNSGNQILDWAVYGTDNFDATQDECDHLADLNTPLGSYTETLTSPVFPTLGHKYIRFYFVRTTGSKTPVFAHLAEFQMYRAEVVQSETCQYNVMGDVAKNLEKVINDQADLELDDLTVEEYQALKQAYDAFIAKFVDPTPLRTVLTAQKGTADAVVVGTNPGFWRAGTAGEGFRTLYDQAKAYDAAGNYSAEQSQQYIDQLQSSADDLYASANPVQTGKWYRIRFAKEEEFEQYGWDITAGRGNSNAETGVITDEDLFGKYMTVTYTERNEDGITEVMDRVSASEFGLGSQIYLDADEDISDKSLSLFRFVAVGDSAYILQNKGTNLFVKAAGTSGAVSLSVHPSLFNVHAIGYGETAIASKSITGASQNFLHGQVANNVVVTWGVNTPGSRSGLYIEEAEDVAADYDGAEFQMPLVYGTLTGLCFPVEVGVAEGSSAKIWGVNKVEGNVVELGPITGMAEGGRPFFLQNGDTDDYSADDPAEMVTLRHGYNVVPVAQEDKALKGTYTSKTVGQGVIIAEGNALVVSKRSTTSVSANGAYISTEGGFDPETTIEIVFGTTDGIETIPATGTKADAAIYDLSGRRLATGRLPKGIYISDGKKVIK
ncbi:MAG: hypothetical protein IJ197_02400 [Bacteroidaceae bacterium]|nr:hypothetical protein [Bacteroidaceae bacterium]